MAVLNKLVVVVGCGCWSTPTFTWKGKPGSKEASFVGWFMLHRKVAPRDDWKKPR
jgi:hypothetical protein